MSDHVNISAEDALLKLKQGNEKFLDASTGLGNISKEIRKDTCDNGQYPYAVVVTCSDSV